MNRIPKLFVVKPATKEKITIAARDKIVFKASDCIQYYSRKHCKD